MIPKGSRIFPLKTGTKIPKTPNGHKDAVLAPSIGYPSDNYGLVLDGQYIVVDFDSDHPERSDLESKLPVTWQQATPRTDAKGRHYLFTVPPGFIGSGKKVWKGSDGLNIADIKAKGYIVGPHSKIEGREYTMVHEIEPVPAPEWLLKFVKIEEKITIGSPEEDGVPHGDHDAFLHNLASWVRGQWGLSEYAISRLLSKGPLEVLQDTDPSDPYSASDCARIAHSAASYVPEMKGKELELIPEGWQSFLDINTNPPLERWHLYGFIPKGELVMIFGKGGIGKSSIASFIAYEVIRKGKSFGFAGIEEPFLRFATRTYLTNKNLSKEYLRNLVNINNEWQFPRDAKKLREALIAHPLDVIYFDSIYGHFENFEGHMNMAEKTRACLSPLAAIAQELGITVIGTFHENKAGDFLGSVEMVNVSRMVLQAVRTKGPTKLKVHKTNFTIPDYSLNFTGELMEAESLEGEPWLEENEEGQIVPKQLYVVKDFIKSKGEFDLDEIEEEEDPALQLKKVLLGDPNLEAKEIAERLNWTMNKVNYWLRK